MACLTTIGPQAKRIAHRMGAMLLAAGLSACSLFVRQSYEAAPGEPAVSLVGDVSLPYASPLGARCIPDVPAALNAVPREGRELGFRLDRAEPAGGLRRHWQGIQRSSFGAPDYLFVSRSRGRSPLLIVHLASRGGGAPPGDRWLADTGKQPDVPPPAEDRVVAEVPYEGGYRHGGGLALVGRVLAVPLVGRERAQVVFYDVADPEHPRRITSLVPGREARPPVPDDASAVALTRLSDGRYLLILGIRSSKILQFFVSGGRALLDPALEFRRLGRTIGLGVGGFQNLALLTQCDGTIYLAGTHNTAVPPPSRGRDHLHWYVLERDRRGDITLKKSGERHLICRRCNFAAGAGLYVAPDGSVGLYATEFGSRGADPWVAVEEFSADR
jgi:hypothetical protein